MARQARKAAAPGQPLFRDEHRATNHRGDIRFFNHTTLADVTDADVFLVYGDDEVTSLPLCRTFLRGGRHREQLVPAAG